MTPALLAPVTVALTTAAMVVLAGPALAAPAPSDAEVGAAYGAMLSKKDAAALGVRGDSMRTFAVSTSDRGTPDAPWLCDLTGIAEVEGKGAPTLFASEVLSLKKGAVSDVSQEIHSYSGAPAAASAYKGILKRITECTGQQQPAAETEGDGQEGMTTQLTHGIRRVQGGSSFAWVRSETTIPGVEGFVSHQYLTVRLVGPYVQIIEVDSEGQNAPNLTAKNIAAADRLTISLGDRWRTS
ncbi:MAG TPA: hypothetical protein DCQ36_06350 [Actinobacteria bacterium]|jgi:hypothetical protein|nr:hypothetical protein [Actinomycetota bacterium]